MALVLPLIGLIVLGVVSISLMSSQTSARVKALGLYWAFLLIELTFVLGDPREPRILIVVGMTLVAGAVTIFALPGDR